MSSILAKMLKFTRFAKSLGYDVSIANKSTGSIYVDFCLTGCHDIEFKFRFSDHYLSQNNYIPAGVICERTDLDTCIGDLEFYHQHYQLLDEYEKYELWQNRKA